MSSLELEKKKTIDALINSSKVVIFSKTNCPYCKKAKKVFDNMKKSYKTVELDRRNDGDIILSILGKLTGAKTVPRVFVNGDCLGGASEIEQLHKKGKLQRYF